MVTPSYTFTFEDQIKEIFNNYIQSMHQDYEESSSSSLGYDLNVTKRLARDEAFQKALRDCVAKQSAIWVLNFDIKNQWVPHDLGISLVLPVFGLTALEKMALFPQIKFDISLLDHYKSVLEYYRENIAIFQNKSVLNLLDILNAIEFLLSQNTIQEQLRSLPKEMIERVNNRSYFSQEKFNRLLFLCQGTNLTKGSEIFEKNKEKIRVNADNDYYLAYPVIAYISSDALFQWYAEQALVQNANKAVLSRSFFFEVLKDYIDAINSSRGCPDQRVSEEQFQIATKRFKMNLQRIYNFDVNVTWEARYHYISAVEHIQGIVLCGILPCEGLTAMGAVKANAFDVSLLEYYRSALEYYKKTNALKDKTVVNLRDILNAVEFLLSQECIQKKLNKLSSTAGDPTHFTQAKFAQLMFLCQEINEQGRNLFDQYKSSLKITGSFLGLLLTLSSWEAVEKVAQTLGGILPEGTIGAVVREYNSKTNNLDYFDPENRKQKEEEALLNFKLSLSKIRKIVSGPIVCTKEDFPRESSFRRNQDGTISIIGILPMEVIAVMIEHNIQFNLALSLCYGYKLVDFEQSETENFHEKIRNHDELLQGLRSLLGDAETKSNLFHNMKKFDEITDALIIAIILGETKLYEPLYKRLCEAIKNKTAIVQEYQIDLIACMANKYKAHGLIKLLSSHPQVRITREFLKIAAKNKDYAGLRYILEKRPEFLEKLPISNIMLQNGDMSSLFQQCLDKKIEKETLQKELTGIQEVLSKLTDIYIPDMFGTLIRVVQVKRLLPQYTTERIVELELATFLSAWNSKGVTHPDPKCTKDSESLLGSFYGYKPELYNFILPKLKNLLSQISEELSLEFKQLCFNLAVLFPNEAEVNAYFARLQAKEDRDNTLYSIITDAANFKIPNKGYWNIGAWFAFVKRNDFSPRAMSFLRAASNMDMKMQLGNTIFARYSEEMVFSDKAILAQKDPINSLLATLMRQFKYDKTVLWELLKKQCPAAYENLLKPYIDKKIKKWKKLQEQSGLLTQSIEEMRKYFRKEAEKDLADAGDKIPRFLKHIIEMYDLYSEKVTLASLVEFRMQDFPDIPKKYRDAVIAALENGYSNEDITKLIAEVDKNKQALTFVPSIVVDGAEIEGSNYRKYELKPLEKSDPMALVAGLKTRCCQHIMGAGTESAMHAYNSPYGVTYRLAAKKEPNAGDWLAQSWTVLSECGTILLFDSIEYSGHANEEMIFKAFKKAAEKLLKKNPRLQEVRVGSSQHARLKLDRYGYTRKPKEEDFRIAGYSEDSYNDSNEIVVLMDRKRLEMVSETEDSIQEEVKEVATLAIEYQIRYGIDTYLKPGKTIKLLGLSNQARDLFKTKHAKTVALLMEEPENPLIEEGFVSSTNHQASRYREGEWYITYGAATKWLDEVFNPKIKGKGLSHYVYAAKSTEVSERLQEAIENTSIKTFTLIVFIGIHAVSMFLDSNQGVCFILDSEPGSDLNPLISASRDRFPNIRVIMPERDLRLQKDYYSCTTFALKSARYYAKHAGSFSQLLADNETDTLPLSKMPAALLKMTQTSLEENLTQAQRDTVVSKKDNLTLLQYYKMYKQDFGGTAFNTAALKTRQNVLEEISETMRRTIVYWV